MWKKELEIIENLGKLYPKFDGIEYKNYWKYNYEKTWWAHFFCKYYLNQRLPYLEKFIKENNRWAWDWYKDYFKITDEQCGKKN